MRLSPASMHSCLLLLPLSCPHLQLNFKGLGTLRTLHALWPQPLCLPFPLLGKPFLKVLSNSCMLFTTERSPHPSGRPAFLSHIGISPRFQKPADHEVHLVSAAPTRQRPLQADASLHPRQCPALNLAHSGCTAGERQPNPVARVQPGPCQLLSHRGARSHVKGLRQEPGRRPIVAPHSFSPIALGRAP